MDRDQRSRQQKSRGGSFARPAQKRSLGSRMGLQKQAPPRQRPGPQPKPPRRYKSGQYTYALPSPYPM